MITLLTYDHPHRKTLDVLWRLLAAGRRPTIVATPWVNRVKQRKYLYGHRPAEKNWPCEAFMDPRMVASNLGLDFHTVNKEESDGRGELGAVLEKLSPKMVVVGGAGILPRDVVTNHTVVNVHPGLLPARRGLDVLKWAVRDLVQVGVTAHVCDERTDLGRRLIEREVPVYPEDTFHLFAMRQYEYELDTINGAVEMVLAGTPGDPIHPGETKPFKRMPKRVEATLMRRFEDYKRVYA